MTEVFVIYSCAQVNKISCEERGTPELYVSVVDYKLSDSSRIPITPTMIDLKKMDAGTYWYICGIMGGEDERIHLGSCETYCVQSDSYIVIEVYQMCKFP